MGKQPSKMEAVLSEAYRLLRRSFREHLGENPLAQFNARDRSKTLAVSAQGVLGSFDAWNDLVSVNLAEDPVPNAVHELLHANAFSDDWTASDLGRRDDIVSFRGLEIQWISARGRKVKGIYHRGINEGVTELFTLHACGKTTSAYPFLLPLARQLARALGFRNLAHAYFRGGYPELLLAAARCSFDLDRLDARAEAAMRKGRLG